MAPRLTPSSRPEPLKGWRETVEVDCAPQGIPEPFGGLALGLLQLQGEALIADQRQPQLVLAPRADDMVDVGILASFPAFSRAQNAVKRLQITPFPGIMAKST